MTLKKQGQAGFSLIELMVAMVIGLLVILAVTQMLANNYRNYRLQSSLSEAQSNMRFVSNIMKESIRNAGYLGGINIDPVSAVYTSDKAISAQPPVPPGMGFVGTDVMTVMSARTCGAVLSADKMFTNGVGVGTISIVTDSCWITSLNALLIADYKSASVFRLNGGATWSDPSKLFKQGEAEVFALDRKTYFLGKRAGADVRDLRERHNGTTNALVEGVDDLKIRYGLDTNSDGIVDGAYVAMGAIAAADWKHVISVNIYILTVSTLANVLDAAGPANFPMDAGVVLMPSAVDKRLRRPFMTTVVLRNRVD